MPAWALVLILLLSLASCDAITPSLPASNEVLAEPLGDLTPGQLTQHIRGDVEFAEVFSPAEGLGPIFVQSSCESCHVGDGKGSPVNILTRFGRFRNGRFDPMTEFGGPQIQHRSLPGFDPEVVPPEATGVTRLIAPNVTGLGYLEIVPDAVLQAMADPDDSDGDGISGRVQLVRVPDYIDPAPEDFITCDTGCSGIGRFGHKAGAINLMHQTVNAYKQDMGITSDFDSEDPVNPLQSTNATDGVPDPEVSSATIDAVVFYLQTLEAPRRRDEGNADVLAGEQVFTQVGCVSCHKSTLRTGPSPVAGLNQVDFHPYTDLLLHDMGPGLDDGYTEGEAETAEWRTAPLWGIGLQGDAQGGERFLLHDGRAKTIDEAIQWHGGEATASATRYNELSQQEKDQLIRFLESL